MKPTDQMPFGKYKGQQLKDVPKDYADWLIRQDGFKDKSPAIYAFFISGADIVDPKQPDKKSLPSTDAALEEEILMSMPLEFKVWWTSAYGRLREDGPMIYIAQLRVAQNTWKACSDMFYNQITAIRAEYKDRDITTKDF